MPIEFTLGSALAVCLLIGGIYTLQWGLRHGIDEDVIVGIVLLLASWGVVEMGPVL